VNVIGHHDPRAQLISPAVKEPQRVSHELCNFRLTKKTLAVSSVEVGVHAGGIPAEQFLLFPPGKRAFGGERVLKNLFPLLFELLQDGCGQRARKPERGKVAAALLLQMRQMIARMKTGGEKRRGCRRAGILPAGCSGFQPRYSRACFQPRGRVLLFRHSRNSGQDARKTGRLEACPTFMPRTFSLLSRVKYPRTP